jgi:hypothetical protein
MCLDILNYFNFIIFAQDKPIYIYLNPCVQNGLTILSWVQNCNEKAKSARFSKNKVDSSKNLCNQRVFRLSTLSLCDA